MKIAFLDVDGVLNVIPESFDEFGGTFHQHFVDNLKTVIDETGADIVLSSSWRIKGLQAIRDMWRKRNLPGNILDITPDLSYHEEQSDGTFRWKRVKRGEEIKAWLDRHKEVSSYVIIDDDTDMLQSQKTRFVKTSDNINHTDFVDAGFGLTKECAKKAIQILNTIHE